MGKCKAKAIQADLGIFTHNLAYSDIFRTLTHSKPEAYSKPSQTSTMEHFAKIVNSYNYFCNISFSRSLLYEINIINFFNAGLIFTPEVFILCKKVWELGGGVEGEDLIF